jgi:hypothetical protein
LHSFRRMRATQSVVGLAISLLAFTVGCSGASPGGGGGGGGSGGDDGWTKRTNIEAVFESYCSECHGAQWSSCWNVQASASVVDEMITSGAMPRVGTLTPSDKSTLETWLGDGAPCNGTPPADGGGGGGPDGGVSGPPPGEPFPAG